MEETRIRFFQVEKCGYYRRGETKPACGDLDSMLAALTRWIKDVHFGETCTYRSKNTDSHDRTFCFNLERHVKTGSYLLTLWNETPSTKGNVMASVPLNATVGAATVQFTKFPKDNIPGYATYFWLLPDRNLFATISFHNRVSACSPFYRYLKGFLTRFFVAHISYKPSDNPEDDLSIEGYQIDSQSGVAPIKPSFAFTPAQNPQHLQVIRSRRAQIKTIAHKEDLVPKQGKSKTLIKQMLINAGIVNPAVAPLEYKVKYELTYSPTEEELEEMISSYQSYQSSPSADDAWQDIGFKFAHEDRTYWLSASVDRHDLQLAVTRDDAEVVNASSLLSALEAKRTWLLRNIPVK